MPCPFPEHHEHSGKAGGGAGTALLAFLVAIIAAAAITPIVAVLTVLIDVLAIAVPVALALGVAVLAWRIKHGQPLPFLARRHAPVPHRGTGQSWSSSPVACICTCMGSAPRTSPPSSGARQANRPSAVNRNHGPRVD
jgi:hypothetical protein